MFGFKNISYTSLKVSASKDFINSVQSIKDIKSSSAKEIEDKRSINSKKFLDEAKFLINKCVKNNDFSIENLKIISDNLLLSLENSRNNPEAYLNLANIFYILGEITLSVKYLKIAQEINPNFSGISNLRDAISSNKIIKNEEVVSDETQIQTSNESQLPKPQSVSLANMGINKPIVRSNVKNMYSVSHRSF